MPRRSKNEMEVDFDVPCHLNDIAFLKNAPELIKSFTCNCTESIGKFLTKKSYDKKITYAKMFFDAIKHENFGFIQLMSPLVEIPNDSGRLISYFLYRPIPITNDILDFLNGY